MKETPHALAAVLCAWALHCVCWSPHAETVKSPWLPLALAALAHLLCWTSHERTRAFWSEEKVALPSTAKGCAPEPVLVTAGGVTPPREPVKVWRLPPDAAPELDAAEVAAAYR